MSDWPPAELIEQIMVEVCEGCCKNDAWRGRLCAYHDGFEDGLYRAQVLQAARPSEEYPDGR